MVLYYPTSTSTVLPTQLVPVVDLWVVPLLLESYRNYYCAAAAAAAKAAADKAAAESQAAKDAQDAANAAKAAAESKLADARKAAEAAAAAHTKAQAEAEAAVNAPEFKQQLQTQLQQARAEQEYLKKQSPYFKGFNFGSPAPTGGVDTSNPLLK